MHKIAANKKYSSKKAFIKIKINIISISIKYYTLKKIYSLLIAKFTITNNKIFQLYDWFICN